KFFATVPPAQVLIEGPQQAHLQSTLQYSCSTSPSNPPALLSFTIQGTQLAPFWRQPTNFNPYNNNNNNNLNNNNKLSSNVALQSITRQNYSYTLSDQMSGDELVVTCSAAHRLLSAPILRTLIVKILRRLILFACDFKF